MIGDIVLPHGGPTRTFALIGGSPAINRVPAPCPPTDQRGVPRPQGTGCDVGAVEGQLVALTVQIVQPSEPHTPGSDITVRPGGFSAAGTRGFLQGGVATLTAKPSVAHRFSGGTLDGEPAGQSEQLTVTMNTAHTVVATFVRTPPGPPPPLPRR